MTTCRSIIQDALLEIGVLSEMEPLTDSQAEQGLRTLNRMIGGWNIERLMIYTLGPTTYDLVAGKQTYTLGPSGDWNTPRPEKIDRIVIRVNSNPQYPLDIPLHVYSDDEWEALPIKGVVSNWPTAVWVQGNFPLNTLSFWPIPSVSGNNILIYSWLKTEAFSSLDAEIIFPSGYEEAILYNLAVRLCPAYGQQPNIVTINMAAQSKARVARHNSEPTSIVIDSALIGHAGRDLATLTRGYLVD